MARPSSACERTAGETGADDEERNKEEARWTFYHKRDRPSPRYFAFADDCPFNFRIVVPPSGP
jgi:hypothetical protein